MTPQFMTPLTRRVFAQLPEPAKREFEAWFRNVMQIQVGSNSLEAGEDRLPHSVRGFARQRSRAAELAIEELREIFGRTEDPADVNCHLGARRAAE